MESADHPRDSVRVDQRLARDKDLIAIDDYAPGPRFFKGTGCDIGC